jgi:hypothetical protein
LTNGGWIHLTDEQRAIVASLQKVAAAAALELSERELAKGKRRIFVVVAVEPQPDGLCALGTGIGHPEDMPVVDSAAPVILKVALATLGEDPLDAADGPRN